MLLPVLRDWLMSWELGTSFETVYIEAQTLLFQQIQQATTSQDSRIEELLSQNEQSAEAGHQPGKLQLREKLAEILKQEDWPALARIAAQDVEKRILPHPGQEESKQHNNTFTVFVIFNRYWCV